MSFSFVISLDSKRCSNPDLDLRYLIPDQLQALAPGVIADDGYDYEAGANKLLIFLRASDRDAASRIIADYIRDSVVLGNRLADCATYSESLE